MREAAAAGTWAQGGAGCFLDILPLTEGASVERRRVGAAPAPFLPAAPTAGAADRPLGPRRPPTVHWPDREGLGSGSRGWGTFSDMLALGMGHEGGTQRGCPVLLDGQARLQLLGGEPSLSQGNSLPPPLTAPRWRQGPVGGGVWASLTSVRSTGGICHLSCSLTSFGAVPPPTAVQPAPHPAPLLPWDTQHARRLLSRVPLTSQPLSTLPTTGLPLRHRSGWEDPPPRQWVPGGSP